MTDVGTVTLQVWRVPARDVAAAAVATGVTARRLRRCPDVSFAKVLGTASDAFVPTAVTPRRWAAITCWRDRPDRRPTRWWSAHAEETASLSLRPLRATGAWSGHAPFEVDRSGWDGPVVVLTRSALRPAKALRFYGAVPAIAAELRAAKGCRLAFGIGEAPLLRQGTVSIWESTQAMRSFAYSTPSHVRAVEATPDIGWYSEQLFARFALVDATGTIDGASIA